MKDFNTKNKNPNVVKLEPKPMKVEGKLLDLKKGTGMTEREKQRAKRFHSPNGTMEPTKDKDLRDPTLTGGHPLGWLQHSAQDDRERKGNKIPLIAASPAGSSQGQYPFPKGEGEKTSGISWQVEEGKEDARLSPAGKIILFVLLLTAAIGFVMESPIMVLTFLLFTIVFYMLMKRGKSNVAVQIDSRGVQVGGTMYSYDNLKSFWIFYDPPYEKYLSIETKSSFSPLARIKLGAQNPVEARDFLLKYLLEKQHPSPFLEVMIEKLGL